MLTAFQRDRLLNFLCSPYFPPDELDSLVAWWRADSLLFQDSAGTIPATAIGDPVGFWGDKSGNGEDVIQTASTPRPSLITGQYGINGQPLVRFDGVTDWLFRTSTALGALTGSVTIAAVVRSLDAVNTYAIAGCSNGSAMSFMLSQGNNDLNLGLWQNGAGPAVSSDSTLVQAVPYCVVAQRSGGTGSWNMAFRLSGQDDGSGVSAVNAAGNTSFAIGRFGGFNAQYWHGDIAEVLVCDTALDLEHILGLEAYLMNRYGL